ncbi:hypothetical protein AB205_0012370 [Aquarana catesbeiana]|uniref:PDZ domain-containing protein n=1 Tax=Aquarana catesbeiana TaxID=8400 RepID=A0A2G9SBL3_AQUCT|nr:hypothetical protein AB205_0012370 [Aquarana catesbeiana]
MTRSAQHHGRLSLDLSHKHPSEYCDTSRPRVSHGSNSLPSSARLGSSRTERIKIPLTPRYVRCPVGSDRGSLSQSECSSPSLSSPPHSPLNLETSSFASSQSQNSIASLPRISISTVPMGERRKDRPLVDEPRHVRVQKGAEPLGISIGGGESGGIFVSKVMAGSIAQQAGLEYGDQLLELTTFCKSLFTKINRLSRNVHTDVKKNVTDRIGSVQNFSQTMQMSRQTATAALCI